MATIECEICGREVDKRGYNVHLRKCKEVQAKALQDKQDKIMNDKKEEQKPEPKPEQKEEIKEKTETKNPKSRNWIKILAAVLGVLIAGIVGILMLISPQSKESSKKESPTRKPGSRLSR